MKVKELIQKLETFDPELDIIIEPGIDPYDGEYGIYNAYDVINGNISPITFTYAEAQSNRQSVEDDPDDDDNDYIQYDYDWIKDPIDRKKVLVISSPEFKDGVSEKESL